MKTLLTITLLLLASSCFSQTWCDAGANWKYSFFRAFYAEGYTEISYTGDTTLNGQTAQILKKRRNVYKYLSEQHDSYDIGEDYTYEDNGVVYILFENNWDTLYNFNASIGDSWRLPKQPLINACDSNSTLTVTATGTKIINSVPLKYLVVDFSFPFSTTDTIVEKIGFIGDYMLPYDYCNGAWDQNEGGVFRCYKDFTFSTYKPHYSGECNDVLSVTENILVNSIKIGPNPVSDQLEIIGEIAPNSEFRVVDALGKKWEVTVHKNTLNVRDLPSGIYHLSIIQNAGMSHHKFIVE